MCHKINLYTPLPNAVLKSKSFKSPEDKICFEICPAYLFMQRHIVIIELLWGLKKNLFKGFGDENSKKKLSNES